MSDGSQDIACFWMSRLDMPDVLRIERQCFLNPRSAEVIESEFRHRNIIGMTARRGGEIVAFMIYRLVRERIVIRTFAIPEDVRSTDVESVMVETLKRKIEKARRKELVLAIPLSELGELNFWKSHGFRATRIEHDVEFSDGSFDDVITMVWNYWDEPLEVTERTIEAANAA